MKRLLYENTCSLCDGPSVETIATIRLCRKHLNLVNAIKADAEQAKASRRENWRAAA
jgi:hypothetical protein